MIHRVTNRFRSAAFFDAFLIHDFVFGEHLEGQFTFAYIITIVMTGSSQTLMIVVPDVRNLNFSGCNAANRLAYVSDP